MKLYDRKGGRVVTLREGAGLVGVTLRTVHNWINDGRLAVLGVVDRAKIVSETDLMRAAKSYQTTKPRGGRGG